VLTAGASFGAAGLVGRVCWMAPSASTDNPPPLQEIGNQRLA
jgi:hypothetical protein